MDSAPLICTACGTVDRTTKAVPGSVAIELVLWLFLILPGVIYTLWRSSSAKQVCGQCGSAQLVPAGSPVGRKLLEDTAGSRKPGGYTLIDDPSYPGGYPVP